jgi:Asp/Glu/hydantoin racemase
MGEMVYCSQRYDELVLEAFKKPELVKDEILNGCREVIEKGAHSVILGSTLLANLATACGIARIAECDAPIFDPICVGVKMLEYRIGLQRSLGIPPISRAGSYRLSASDFVNTTMKHFDFAQRA